jgi:hypothetical protein
MEEVNDEGNGATENQTKKYKLIINLPPLAAIVLK